MDRQYYFTTDTNTFEFGNHVFVKSARIFDLLYQSKSYDKIRSAIERWNKKKIISKQIFESKLFLSLYIIAWNWNFFGDIYRDYICH